MIFLMYDFRSAHSVPTFDSTSALCIMSSFRRCHRGTSWIEKRAQICHSCFVRAQRSGTGPPPFRIFRTEHMLSMFRRTTLPVILRGEQFQGVEQPLQFPCCGGLPNPPSFKLA